MGSGGFASPARGAETARFGVPHHFRLHNSGPLAWRAWLVQLWAEVTSQCPRGEPAWESFLVKLQVLGLS